MVLLGVFLLVQKSLTSFIFVPSSPSAILFTAGAILFNASATGINPSRFNSSKRKLSSVSVSTIFLACSICVSVTFSLFVNFSISCIFLAFLNCVTNSGDCPNCCPNAWACIKDNFLYRPDISNNNSLPVFNSPFALFKLLPIIPKALATCILGLNI